MNGDQAFVDNQDAELERAKARWKEAAQTFDKAERVGSGEAEQVHLLDEWQDAAREFWRAANAVVVDCNGLVDDLFERWKSDRIQTAHNMVSGLVEHQLNVRHHRERLGIPLQKYEWSPAVVENLQSVLAWY